MFKIFRKICCGLDVHKTWIYDCIGITDSNSLTAYKQTRFKKGNKTDRKDAKWICTYLCVT